MRSAIVGCGTIARVHAACIKKIPGNELVAVADNEFEKAVEFADEFGGRPYESLEKMLEEEQADVLHICTPHYLHTPMAICGLQHNANVFMEKPPVISFEQLEQLRGLNTGKRLGFCFQNRYNPGVIKIKEMIDSGETGRILGARGMVTWSRDEQYYLTSGWRGRLVTEGGGALINQSIHTLDLLNYFVGDKPRTVDAVMTNHHLKNTIEVEDTVSAYITYPEAKVCFYATTAYVANSAPIIELECEKMRIRLEDMDVFCFTPDGSIRKVHVDSKIAIGKTYWGTGHEDCIRDFYDSIREGRRFALDLDGVEDTIRLMLLVYRSGRTGTEQKW